MTALARTGKSEAFAERRIALGVLATLAPPVAVLSFAAGTTIGRIGPISIVSPVIVILIAGSGAYLYAISNAAFSAATQRRRARYELLTALGAKKRHLRSLLGWELGVPAAVGIGVGILIGTSIGLTFDPLGIKRELDPAEGVSLPVGAVTSAVFVAAPAAFGVFAAASASAARVGKPISPSQSTRPDHDTKRFTKLGLVTLALSVPLLIVSILAFSFLSFSAFEQWAPLGIALGVLGTLSGTTLFTPAILRWVNRQFFATASSTAGVRELNDRPRRVLGISGAVLALSALVVMATAGLLSDEGQEDQPGDRRQLVTSPAALSAVERLAEADGNAVVDSVVIGASRNNSVIEAAQLDGEIISVRHWNAALTPELAAFLELGQEDIDFVEAGGALVDSEVLGDLWQLNEETEQYEPLDIKRISRGGGIGQPGPDVYVRSDPNVGETLDGVPLNILVRFEDPISTNLENALWNEVRTTLELPRSVDDSTFRWVLTAIAGALLFSFALSSSNLTAVELEDEFSTLVALGASPKVRPRVLAAQSAWLLGLGVLIGSAVGSLLFWAVTRGDSSVPDPIIPIGAILTLAGTAAVATLVVRVMHSHAEPALSSRPQTTVDA